MAQLDKRLRKLKKLNFGCGWDIRKDYLNVDVWGDCKPDLLIEDHDYSMIPHNHYEEILANDVLEHIPRPQTLSVLLEWARYLKPGGKLHLQTSSVMGVMNQLQTQSAFADQHGWFTCLFGNQAHGGDFHHNSFTETTLKTYLMAAGFVVDNIELKDKWLFFVDAHKAHDWTKAIHEHRKKDNEAFTKAIFQEVFGRDPDALGGQHILEGLNSGNLSRIEALKHLLDSSERLYKTAEAHNL